MKKYLSFLMMIFLSSALWAQHIADQNPNYKISVEKYTYQLYHTPNTMATTVQDTYTPIDHWQDRQDARADYQSNKWQRRQDRRMARAQGGYYSASPGLYYPYYSNYNYGWGSGWGARGYYGCGIGATVRLGNVFIGF